MAKILIPTPLRKFTGDQSTIETNGKTVQEAILELTEKHAPLKQYLLDADNNIRSYIRIYLGEDDINSLQKGQTTVEDETVISIIPAIAGGI
jgi:molybdopterin converting factor small subunit